MPIVMLIIGAITAVGVILWRIQAAGNTADTSGNSADAPESLQGKPAFRRKAGKPGAKLVTDPREAAIILMLEVARADGEISLSHQSRICSLIVENFQFSPEDAEGVLAQAAWVSAGQAGTEALIRRMTMLVINTVSRKDVVDLDGMLVDVSEAEGLPDPHQMAVLQIFRSIAGVSA